MSRGDIVTIGRTYRRYIVLTVQRDMVQVRPMNGDSLPSWVPAAALLMVQS